MNPPDTPTVGSAKRPDVATWLGWLVVLALIAYFVVKNVPRYFVFTPESYGKYFWPRLSWLFPHVACGLLAILIGPLQFWPRLRRDYLGAHRIAGRVYVVAVLAGAVAAFGMAASAEGGAAYALGLSGLATAWITTTAMAFIAIRRKQLTQHKQWMVRSYVVTFAFVTFRLLDDAMGAGHILADEERAKLLAWACWAVPLLITEVVIQGGAVLKAKPAAGG